MNKLNQTFKINPLYEVDGYKVGHKAMLANNTTRLYGTWIPRSLKHMSGGIDKVMSAGQQLVVRYLHSTFAENFFFTELRKNPFDGDVIKLVELKNKALKFVSDMSQYLGMEYDGKHFEELWELGYLPIKIKSLPEGMFTNPNIPHMTFINTVDGYAWLTLFLETMISKLAWQMPTAATIANKFRENANDWVNKTDKDNLWLTDFMCHDFHSRGGNPFTSIAIGLGHAITNKGSDTLNVIPASEYYYDETEMPIFSVNASEHSVTCTQLFYYEDRLRRGLENGTIKHYYSFDLPCEGSIENPDYLAIAEYMNLKDWIGRFPNGILSYVGDTMNLWKVITNVFSRLKPEILSREGKLVLRPDSGNPVDIICGEGFTGNNGVSGQPDFDWVNTPDQKNWLPHEKGVIELLWEIFGGIVNEQGYKVLDSHIGAIYGDSINLQRQVNIYERLEAKGFASTNIVLGIGSYVYVMTTRDTMGFAAKGAWFEVEEEFYASPESLEVGVRTKSFNIYKDPITDDGTKKSLKGLCKVDQIVGAHGKSEIFVKTECTWEEEEQGLLQTIYEDGNFLNQTTLTEIRNRVNEAHKNRI
jgi:nicotinamide phosphoribosyltransferase